MLSPIKILMSPTLSAGLQIVQNIADTDATRKWFAGPVGQLISMFGDIKIIRVTPEMVREWSDVVEAAEYSEWTKNSYRRAVRAFFNHLVDIGHLPPENNPVTNFKINPPPSPQPKHLRDDEVQKILDHSRYDIRAHAVTLMLYDTGCRVSDLAAMRMSNLVIQHRKVFDHLGQNERELVELAYSMGLESMIKSEYQLQAEGKALVMGKGQKGKKKPRWVFFGHDTCTALQTYFETRPANAPDYVFLSQAGEPLVVNSFYYIFKQVCKRAGVEASPHMMRHTFAYRLMRNGADPKMVQSLMGHSELSMTLHQYYNFHDDELWEVHRQFSQ
jgi:site-specific recombinase XerD